MAGRILSFEEVHPETGQTTAEQRFNYMQSRARMPVENAFGRLKGCWRCFLKHMNCHLTNVPNGVGNGVLVVGVLLVVVVALPFASSISASKFD